MKKPDMKGMGFPTLIAVLIVSLLVIGIMRGDVTIRDSNGNQVTVIPE